MYDMDVPLPAGKAKERPLYAALTGKEAAGSRRYRSNPALSVIG